MIRKLYHRICRTKPKPQVTDAHLWLLTLSALHDIQRKVSLMATKEQLDKFKADVAAMIDAAADEIKAAFAAAQAVPPADADAALDALDVQVQQTTQSLKDDAAKLRTPPAAPAPAQPQ